MNKKGNLLSRMERKWGRYAISNLTMYMIAFYVIGIVLELMSNGTADSFLCLDMNAVFHGQIWRLVTFLLIPPSLSPLVIITLFFYASIGQTLERTWGTFYYNIYIFSGIIFTIVGNAIAYLITLLATGQGEMIVGTNYYILMSMFLAFAYLYPDMQVLVMFILPIKVKWMAYLYYADMIYEIYVNLQYVRGSYVAAWGNIASIVMSLLNFFLFYFMTKHRTSPSLKQRKRKHEYQQKMKRVTPKSAAIHRCAVCGATSEEHPDWEFRFCSKCNGNYEYCQNHLFSHEHVK